MLSPKLNINFYNKKIKLFHFWGVLGFICGVSLGIALTLGVGLPLWVLAIMSLCGAATFFAHVFIQKIITGNESLVYYRHEIAILSVCSLMLWLIHQPVIPFLEITLLGVGTFLAFGRIGCFNVGCCHGRPSKVGFSYTHQHAEEGFPHYYVGIKIFPLPLVESFFVTITVIVGAFLFLGKFPQGTVLIWYTVFYGAVRFVLEFFRGDPERPYLHGLSEAQWTTWFLIILSLIGSITSRLPLYYWQIIITFIISITSMTIIVFHKKWKTYSLLNPTHIQQLAMSFDNFANSGAKKEIEIYSTQLGISCSHGKIVVPDGTMLHFTFSNQNHLEYLDKMTIKKMAKYLKTIQKISIEPNIIEKGNGIFQVTFWQPRDNDKK